jgi:Phosphodiester glycosidase
MQRTTASPNEPGRADVAAPASRAGRCRARHERPRKERSPQAQFRRRTVLCAVLSAFLVMFGYTGVTLTPYLTAPGTDGISARVAEWGRDHHLSWAVTWLENATYTAPPVGGNLTARQRAQLKGLKRPVPIIHGSGDGSASDLPANIAPLAADPAPGEGVWNPVTLDRNGVPIIEQAALRPDAQHTSVLAYVAWMNRQALRFTLQPGYQQPGGNWPTTDHIGTNALTGLAATFNGGFKVSPNDALGGYYADGRTAVPLVTGKAAEVFYRDGSVKIGEWGVDETMTPQVTAVRENLSPLVEGGQVQVGSGAGSSSQWGYTVDNEYYIARSGVGMTATGDIVYVSGPTLSVHALAELLKAAGAKTAMELDINPEWVSCMFYSGSQANPAPVKLWDFTQPADRYLQPSDRDFVSVYLR